jgi:hypothetical protein
MKRISFGRIARFALPAAAAISLVAAGDASAAQEYSGSVYASYGNATLYSYASGQNLGLQTLIADTAADSHSVQLNWSIHLVGGETVVGDQSYVMSSGSGSGKTLTWWYDPAKLKGNTTGYITYYICKYSGGFNSACTSTYSIRFDIG